MAEADCQHYADRTLDPNRLGCLCNALHIKARTRTLNDHQRQRDDNTDKTFGVLRGRGIGGREENRPKRFFFVGNATTITFCKCKL